MIRLTESQLKGIMPRVPADRARDFLARQGDLDHYGVTANARRYAMFLANVAWECDEMREMVENGNYRLETIRKTWPGRFPTNASAAPFAHNPQKLFNHVYGNRMGNGPAPSGDGYRYRGRSLPHLTGKDAYHQIGAMLGLPLLDYPDLVNDPRYFVRVGGAFWQWKNLNTLADADNFTAVVARWNGGYNGMAGRRAYLQRAMKVLAEVGHDVPLPKPRPPLPSSEVAKAQERLRELGYFPGRVDGDEGELTRDAVLSFQAANSLPLTGILDEATIRELAIAGPKYIPDARRNADATALREKGSKTVTLADRIKRWGKWIVGGGAVGYATEQTDVSPLETARNYLDQASSVRWIVETIAELGALIFAHKFLLVAAVGVGVYLLASRIIQARVADEQSGANRGI